MGSGLFKIGLPDGLGPIHRAWFPNNAEHTLSEKGNTKECICESYDLHNPSPSPQVSMNMLGDCACAASVLLRITLNQSVLEMSELDHVPESYLSAQIGN